MGKEYTSVEDYIIDESPEIKFGESEGWSGKILEALPALKNRNYRYYFVGQLISLVGTWLQIIAQGWLVLELTHSAFLIGLVAALSNLPTLLFSLVGGVIVDRFSKKKIVILTQTASMVLAFILGILTVLHVVTVPEIAIIAFLLGLVTAVDMPARQAYAIEIVGRKELASAIALNAGVFNGARVIGPSIAGILIAVVGTGGAFMLNGASYIAAIIALFYMNTKSVVHGTHPRPLRAIEEGISYAWNHSVIRNLLFFTGVVAIFGWSHATILPLIAKNIFHVGADGLGYLYAAEGSGALLATLLVSGFSKKIPPALFILGGCGTFGISIFAFAFVTNIYIAFFFLFFAGIGLLMQYSTMLTVIQHSVADEFRGRVMSIYTLMFIGFFPFGNFGIGYFSEHFGTSFALAGSSVIVLLFGAYMFTKRHELSRIEHSGRV